jgi:hypothetical protein
MLENFCVDGDIKSGPCNHCEALRECVLGYRTLERGGIVADNVMCATCSQCGKVAWTTAQAGYRFREAREQIRARRTSVNVPLELEDYISHRLSLAGCQPAHYEQFFRALLQCCVGKEEEVAEACRTLEHKALSLISRKPLTVPVTAKCDALLTRLKDASGIKNTSELMRRLIVLSDGLLSEQLHHNLDLLTYAYAG